MCSTAKLTDALVQGFLIGAILPVIPWYLYRRTGRPIWRQINVPLVLHGVRSKANEWKNDSVANRRKLCRASVRRKHR